MTKYGNNIRRLRATSVWAVAAVCGGYFAQLIGCFPCAHDVAVLFVHGEVLDAETLQGATDAAIGGRTFTNAEETDWVPPLIFDGSATFPPPEEDGTFRVEFTRRSHYCRDVVTEFPPPDQIEIIVVRDGCEQTFRIEINEDTVVDMGFPEDVLELKDPILVEPCAE